MSLRSKLLVLFIALAVAPLCALGLFNHVQTMRGLEALLARQTHTLADRAAREIGERLAVQQSDLLLLAENVETQRLLAAHAARDTAALADARHTAESFLQQLWRQYGPWYRSIEVRDAGGAVVHLLGEEPPHAAEAWGYAQDELLFRQPVPGGAGEIVAHTRTDALLPPDVLEPAFGERGYTIVVDHASGRLLHHPDVARVRQPLDPAVLAQLVGADTLARESLRIGTGDSLHVASHAFVQDASWTVLSAASLAEFAPPFTRVRTINLIVLLLVTLTVFIAFAIATRRATSRLHALTRAADAVGRGDFAPTLPAGGTDEVGRLTGAFGLMTSQVSEMMRQMERSRQMAAIGAFAAEVAHEIRNPLTSVKLNLQRIERLVARGRASGEAAAPLGIALREIERLDRVVRGVLHLGSPRTLARERCSVHGIISRAIESVSMSPEQGGVDIVTRLDAPYDTVAGDAGQLQGALLNVMLNAVDAMPMGGTLRIDTAVEERDGTAVLVVRIGDSGPGITPEQRARLFHPFFSTKPDGTGLGLAIALRTAQEHGGTLSVEEEGAASLPGAVFRFELPVAHAEVYA